MEGGLLIHAAWALSFTFVWVYRRWFEKTGPRSLEFERFCATRPLIVALSVRAGTERATCGALAASLRRGETLATHGAWPWIHYVLGVEWSVRPGVVVARITRARRLRTRERPPPALTAALGAAMRGVAAIEQVWLHPRAYVDVSGREPGTCGWRLLADAPEKRPCTACDVTPAWAHAPVAPPVASATRRTLVASVAEFG
jgi:hypothetical protein